MKLIVFISSPWEAMGLQTIVSNIFCFELLPTWMHPSILWLMDCDETLRTVSGQLFRRVYALSYEKHSEYSQWISANKQDKISWASLPYQPVSYLCPIRVPPRIQPSSYWHTIGRLFPLYEIWKTLGNPTAHNDNIVCNVNSFNIPNLHNYYIRKQKNSTYWYKLYQ